MANKTFITCMGEILIDMVQGDRAKKIYEAHPGGAPANVAVGISRLGGKASFIGKVGQDKLGDFLIETLKGNNVETKGLKRGGRTGIALVSLDNQGERSFDFYEKLVTYSELDVDNEVIEESEIFHFGSISLISKPESLATIKCLKHAKASGCTISYDPNLRMNLWRNSNIAREGIKVGLTYADILKVSKEELEFITEKSDLREEIKALLKINSEIKLIAVTDGGNGSWCYFEGRLEHVPALKAEVVDTTGAGDAFMAGLLFMIQKQGGLGNMNNEKIMEAFKVASVVGSITTTQKGAMSALPTFEEVQKRL